MASKPLSVVIADNARKKFLRDAVASAVNQSLDRSQYEVLVAINYDEGELGPFFRNHGVAVLHVNADRGGALYAAAIKEAEGEVICFLDDDDMFDYRKLERVSKVFRDDEHLGYYHHNVKLVDESGVSMSCDSKNAYVQYLCKNAYNAKIYAWTSLQKSSMIRTVTYGMRTRDPFLKMSFNSSSIAVRKDLAAKYLSELEKLYSAQDALHFLEALMSDYAVMHEPLTLTYYRIHPSNLIRQDYHLLGPKAYNDYLVLKAAGKQYLDGIGVDIDKTILAYWRPMLYYGIKRHDLVLAFIAGRGALKKLISSKLGSLL
jgi:glycosyltransferase involved in cell wall biosynthesis